MRRWRRLPLVRMSSIEPLLSNSCSILIVSRISVNSSGTNLSSWLPLAWTVGKEPSEPVHCGLSLSTNAAIPAQTRQNELEKRRKGLDDCWSSPLPVTVNVVGAECQQAALMEP